MIQLMAEWRRNTTFNGQHDHPNEDENWVLISFAVKKFNINYVVLSMKTFVRAEINILICSSLLPSPRAKAQNYLRTSDLTELFHHKAAYQSCGCCLSLSSLYAYFWCKSGETDWKQGKMKSWEKCVIFAWGILKEISFFPFEVMEPQTILLSSQKPISSQIFLNGCAVSALPSCFRVS